MKKGDASGKHPESPFQRARIRAGLTQETAAESLDCGTRSIQGYEAGRCNPSVPVLKRMLDLYQCEIADLYPEDAEKKHPPNILEEGEYASGLLSQVWPFASRAVNYRIPIPVREMRICSTAYGNSVFYVCPKCKSTLEREFVSFYECQ